MAKPKTTKQSARYTGVRLLNNGKWAARYTGPEGREIEKLTFAGELEAHKWRLARLSEIERGVHVHLEGSRLTVGQYFERWAGIQIHRDGTAVYLSGNFRNHVLPKLEDRKLASVKRSDIQGLVKAMSRTLAPSTVDGIYYWIATLFRSAVADRLIPETPCRDIKMPRGGKKKVVIPTEEEFRSLLGYVPDRYWALVVLWAGSGLRRCEALGLTIDRVNFLGSQEITVDRQLHSKTRQFVPLKTDASDRVLPMSSSVKNALAWHLANFGSGPEGVIFTNEKKDACWPNRINEMFAAVVLKAELRPNITPHTLRHFYASLLIRDGISLPTVQKRLGHKTMKETYETYIHLWPGDEDMTSRAVDDFLIPLMANDHGAGSQEVTEGN